MTADLRREVARLLGRELLRFATAEKQPLADAVQRHAQSALESIGELGTQFCLPHIPANELQGITTSDELVNLLDRRLSHVSEVDDSGWTAF